MPTFTYVHPSAGSLDDGRPLGVGDEVELTQKELDAPSNYLLVQQGRLIDITKPTKAGKR